MLSVKFRRFFTRTWKGLLFIFILNTSKPGPFSDYFIMQNYDYVYTSKMTTGSFQKIVLLSSLVSTSGLMYPQMFLMSPLSLTVCVIIYDWLFLCILRCSSCPPLYLTVYVLNSMAGLRWTNYEVLVVCYLTKLPRRYNIPVKKTIARHKIPSIAI